MNKKEMTVFIVVIAVLLGFVAFFTMSKNGNKENNEEFQLISISTSTIENKKGIDVENNTATLEKQEINTSKNNSKKTMQTQTITEGLTYVITKEGTGEVAKSGATVSVHYRGTLTDGSVFDESYKRGQPFEFSLGAGQVIKGWDLGVAGMKIGEKRTLTIAPSLGYGASGVGPIPGNATLIFDVELLDVK